MKATYTLINGTKETRFTDLFNNAKTWVIRKQDSSLTWNQEINGVMFYPSFSFVSVESLCNTLGTVNAQKIMQAIS